MGKPHKSPSFLFSAWNLSNICEDQSKVSFQISFTANLPIGEFTWWPECRHWTFPTSAYLKSKDRSSAQELVCAHVCDALHSRKDFTQFKIQQETVHQINRKIMKQWSNSKVKKAWQSPSLLEYTRDYQNCQWCVIFLIHLELARANNWSWNGNGCVALSLHSKVASCLPGLGHWVPGEDRGEEVGF